MEGCSAIYSRQPQPSKTSVSASAQGHRTAGDARGFRTSTSASARRSSRPTRRHSSARAEYFWAGRSECRGGVKVLRMDWPIVEVSCRNPRHPHGRKTPPSFLSSLLLSVCCRSKTVSQHQRAAVFFCLPTHHPQGRK
jgi:hypothetical protein